MDDSMFDLDGGSSDFDPGVKAKPKAVKKASVSKPTAKKVMASKPKAVTKSKTVVPKKRSKAESENEESDAEPDRVFDDESLLDDTPPKSKKVKPNPVKSSHKKPLADIVNEAISHVETAVDSPQPKKKKRVSEQYQKLTQLEHIIKRPDTYIGSVERTEQQMWVYNTEQDSMEFRKVSFVPGIFKIFDEILVNAADNKQNDKNQDEIRVTIDREKGEISVMNNGRGIPIEIHSKEQIYIPEMIFGHLLTGSNYDDDEQKITGGRNGYGAKLCNIFSTEFTVETVDSRQKKKYKQTWTSNMSNMGKAKITDIKSDDFTRITFKPDFAKFGMDAMDDDLEALFKRRVYDLAGTCKGVKVFLNGSRIPIRDFKKYIEMYTKAIKTERGEEAAQDKSEIIIESTDPRWEIGFAVSDGSFQQVSFVNSISTTFGGSHVNYIADQITNKLIEIVKKKNKGGAQLKPNQIRNHIFIFVNALIVNPAFTSQTKEQLTTKPSQFGSKCVVSDAFMKKVEKTEVISNILHFAQQKADQILKKSDGSKRSRMTNPKLTDANRAGTKDGPDCTLILTEGDSAKALAMAGRSVVGPDLFGVFPLRGKLLNVRDASIDQISKNQEIQNIKNFLGLQHKKIYTDTKGLRYGHLMIMTDQDHDGSHIKGLLINFLQVQFPSLLRIPDFLVEFITPIVKVWKGDPKRPSQSRTFFTIPEYETWKEAHRHEQNKWEHKYYKGLGTSNDEDAQSYFNDLDKHHKGFETMKDEEVELIDLAFSKKKADERKEWLRQFRPGTFLDHSVKKISYTEFINKELILFSMADNIRSIPSAIDGLKPGQRKVLYTCLKKNIKKDMKLVELAGLVSNMTAYHHGETSLQQTIVGLAQTFVGSNNVNCLEPSGSFGSRLQGGSDSASPRYIFTRLSPFARKLFHQADEPLLKYNTDEERTIEPETYAPVVPMVLVNGADGIGTGWSSSIPNYNPEDIVNNLKRRMKGEDWHPMQPWFRGFKGVVSEIGPDRYKFSGIIRQSGDNEVEITELPIRVWTQDFKEKLEEIIKAEKVPSFIKDYKDYNTHKDVHFIIQMEDKHMKAAVEEGLEEKFKLSKTLATSNLVAFDAEGRITKYPNVEAIMDEFFRYRLQLYARRKEWLLADMNKDLRKLTNQARFIQMIIDHKLIISKKKKSVLIAELKKLNFDAFPKIADATKAGETEVAVEDDDLKEDDTVTDASSFDYLLGMALWSLTQERVEKLLKQIQDKEVEIDTLMKKSKEDLWCADLDEFITEWRTQLEDEHQRARQIRKGRRISTKFKTAKAPVKKRKGLGDPDDSDFEEPKMKKSAPAPKPKKLLQTQLKVPYVAPKTNALNNALLSRMLYTDGPSDMPESLTETPADSSTESKSTNSNREKEKPITTKTIKVDSDSDEAIAKPIPRQARATAQKITKYVVESDSDSDNGDGLLADLGDMVKGLPTKTNDSMAESRTLFATSTSRPSSSHGFKVATKPMAKLTVNLSEDDETDYKSLVPQQSPRRSILITNKEDTVFNLDDEDDVKPVLVPKPATKPVTNGKKSKTITEVKAKKPAPKKAAPMKQVEQSPVAKAYAKRLAKKKVVDSDDEVDAMADDLLDSPSASETEAPAVKQPSARPARRTVTTKKKMTYDFDDDEEDEDSYSSDGFSESD